jgi:hypothetical protein
VRAHLEVTMSTCAVTAQGDHESERTERRIAVDQAMTSWLRSAHSHRQRLFRGRQFKAPVLRSMPQRGEPQRVRMTAIPWVLLGIGYVFTRLINVTRVPLFMDEGVYLYAAQSILGGALLRGFGEGKILEGWLIAVPLGLGVEPVLAARLLYVLVGLIGLAATCLLADWLFDRRVALVAGILYTVVPYLLFFERLATPDALLASLGMLAALLSLRMLNGDWRPAAALGIALVLAALAKSPVGLYFLLAPALALTLMPAARSRRQLAQIMGFSYLPSVIVVTGAIVVVAYRWRLGLQPFGFGVQEILAKTPGGYPAEGLLVQNVQLLASWLVTYLTLPLALLLAVTWVAALVSRTPGRRFLALLAGLWLVIFVVASGWWVPRYALPALPAAIVIVAWGIVAGLDRCASSWLEARWPGRRAKAGLRCLNAAVVLGVMCLVAPLDLAIIFHPESASLAKVDRSQYVEGAASGYGFPEAAAYLEQKLAEDGAAQVVSVHVSDYARLRAYAAPSLHPRTHQVQIVDGRNEDEAGQIKALESWLQGASTTYVLTGSGAQWTLEWQRAFPNAELVASFSKPGGTDAVEIRRIPRCCVAEARRDAVWAIVAFAFAGLCSAG